MTLALVFPGQGAQTIGMGKDLSDAYPASNAVFQEVDDALGQNLSELIWSGDIAELTLTENAQPALMATSIAAMRALEAEGFDSTTISYVAGHSLGEYSALCAVGAFSVSDTAKLLKTRGLAMQSAVPVGVGAMAALLGLDFATVKDIAAKAAGDQVCAAANDNDPGQVVVSGNKEAVERAIDLAKEAGAKRAVLLPVSAPFHCALMQPAADKMAEALAGVEISAPSVPVVANVEAQAITDPDQIRSLLVQQVTGLVRWRESVSWMHEQGVSQIYEVGAGKALSGMIRRVAREIECKAVGDADGVRAALSD